MIRLSHFRENGLCCCYAKFGVVSNIYKALSALFSQLITPHCRVRKEIRTSSDRVNIMLKEC